MCTYCETFNSPAYNHRYNCSSSTCNIALKERWKGLHVYGGEFIAPKLSVEIVVGQGQW